MYREICRQLEERGPEVEELWGSDPQRRRAVRTVSEIISARMGWPTTRFIPQDPLEILFWDHHSTAINEFADADVVEGIEAALGVKFPSSPAASYGRFIDQLLRVPVI